MKRLQAAVRSDLNIYSVARLKEKFSAALDQCDRLAIDLSGVKDLDSAGVQLLVALKNEGRRQNKTIEYHSCSPEVLESLQVFQLQPDLEVSPEREI